jgi:LacI family transcriptional regulator
VDLGLSFPELNIPRVSTDNPCIGRMAAEYFIERGFKNYLCIDRWNSMTEQERRGGFEQELKKNKLTCHIHSFSEKGNPRIANRDERQAWLVSYLSQLPRPLAVFAQHDTLGSDVIQAALAAGLRVPEEIAVLSAENDDMACECCPIPLSSIDCNLEEVGYQGAAMLDRLMDGGAMPPPLRIPPKGIVDRKSSDIPAIANVKAAMAVNFMRLNCHRDIGIEEVCEYVNLSKAGLQRIFIVELGQSPGALLRKHRLIHAQNLLRNTATGLNEIASMSGYGSAIALCNAFRREFKCTPGEFRKKCRKEAGTDNAGNGE